MPTAVKPSAITTVSNVVTTMMPSPDAANPTPTRAPRWRPGCPETASRTAYRTAGATNVHHGSSVSEIDAGTEYRQSSGSATNAGACASAIRKSTMIAASPSARAIRKESSGLDGAGGAETRIWCQAPDNSALNSRNTSTLGITPP